MNMKNDEWQIEIAVKERSEELVEKATKAAKDIADKLDSVKGKDFAKSQVRNLMVILDREPGLGAVRLWMKYQEARNIKGWESARPCVEELFAYCEKVFQPQGALVVRHAARKATGFLIQALQFEVYRKAAVGRQS